jgi:hypothetical protein
MGARDPRVDAYIANAAPFAQPILKRLRTYVHSACPGVEETIKWRVPAFDYKGPFCGMAAFKQHCNFLVWKAALLRRQGFEKEIAAFEQKLTSLDDLPPDRAIRKVLKAAAALNDAGVKAPRARTAPKPPIAPPTYFIRALRKDRKAHALFEAFSPSHKREYVEWITDARTEETRQRRIARAVEWIGQGKPRNWKYR